MANESIELCKKWDGKGSAKRMSWPAIMSRKLDGVPARIRNIGGHIFAFTRQNEVFKSIDHVVDAWRPYLTTPGSSVVGELYIEGVPFKDISGLARQHAASPELQWFGFDADLEAQPALNYSARLWKLHKVIGELYFYGADENHPLQIVPYRLVQTPEQVEEYMTELQAQYPKLEGAVIHSCGKPFQPGTRRWDTQKYKPRPTMDLLWTGVEEAEDKYGNPKGMVGRVICEYKGKPVGVGPGAMTHKERTAIWKARSVFFARRRVAEVGYMPDETYDALREPTFVRLREWNKEVSYD